MRLIVSLSAFICVVMLGIILYGQAPPSASIPPRPTITLEKIKSDPNGMQFLLNLDEEYIAQLTKIIEDKDKEIADLQKKLKTKDSPQ